LCRSPEETILRRDWRQAADNGQSPALFQKQDPGVALHLGQPRKLRRNDQLQADPGLAETMPEEDG